MNNKYTLAFNFVLLSVELSFSLKKNVLNVLFVDLFHLVYNLFIVYIEL